MLVDTYANGERSRREEVIARQRAFDEEQGELAKEEAILEDQEVEREQREAVSQMMLLERFRKLQPQIEAEQNLEDLRKDKPSLFAYSAPFAVAGFKDLIDLVGIGSLPFIGTAITILCAILIFMLLLLIKKNSSLFNAKIVISRIVVLVCGTAIEGFMFGLNFLPIQTITMYIIYEIDKHFSDKQIKIAASLLKKIV